MGPNARKHTGAGGAVATVTIDRIVMISAEITAAVNKASNPTSQKEADAALVGACGGACGLLRDWLDDDDWWRDLRPADGTVADAIPDQDDFVRLLGPSFKDAIGQLAKRGIVIHDTYVDEARKAVNETARLHSRARRQALLDVAKERVSKLRDEVCSLATNLTTSSVRRRRAISVLKRTVKVLASVALSIALSLTATTQHEVAHDLSVAVHDSLSVVVTHQIAHEAAPNLRIEPRGPEMQMEVG
jgi:hypothetical protein